MRTRHALAGILAASMLTAATPARAAVLVTACSATDWPWSEPQVTERFSKTVPLPKGGTVVVSNISGNVVVTGGPGDQVVIEAVKRGRSADDLKALQVDVTTTEGRVEIATRYPTRTSGWRDNAEVSYTLTVPRRAMVRVKTVSGDVQLSTVDGEVRCESVSGDVRVWEVAHVDGVVSVSGDVVLKSATSSEPVTITSVSGDVTMAGVKAPAISGSSVSGDLRLTDVATDRIAFKTVSGDLSFSGPLARGGHYAFKSHSGDVSVRVLNNVGFEVIASSFSGDVSTTLPLTTQGGSRERHGPMTNVRGTVGDGSAQFEVNTFSGDIRILSGPAPVPPVPPAPPAPPIKK